MEQRISFVTLGVKDLARSIDFYENKLGWKRSELSNGNMIMFQMNGVNLAIYPIKDMAKDATVNSTGRGFKGVAFCHNVWSTKKVDLLINSLREKGVKIVREPQKVSWGGYNSYIADPDDNLWEIAYSPEFNIE